MTSSQNDNLSVLSWETLWIHAGLIYIITFLIVFLGVVLGYYHLPETPHHGFFQTPHHIDLLATFANWDGQWYAHIACKGYNYNPHTMSSVAFFPAFPLLGRGVSWLLGCDADVALFLVANLCFLLSLAGLLAYEQVRFGSISQWPAALMMALFPIGFFFRMAYSEALFVLLALLVFYGSRRCWPIVLLAVLSGLATATRAVGLALAPVVSLTVWQRFTGWRRWLLLAALLPLSAWGLAAYIGFQYIQFGEPLAFIKAQESWRQRPPVAKGEELLAVLALEPIFDTYDPASPGYWRRFDHQLTPPFSLQFANPLYFLMAVFLIVLGAWRKWLSLPEVVFAVAVLGISYVSRGYAGCMTGQARYALVVFPVYMVLGRLCTIFPSYLSVGLMALSGFLLGIYAALFAGWFLFV